MDPILDSIKNVEIENEGVFKYVLIKVYGKEEKSQKNIVRGNFSTWHADIYEKCSEDLQALGLDCECLGGGRIRHIPNERKIQIYGYSQGYGKADHEEAKKILLQTYKNYEIDCSDDGY